MGMTEPSPQSAFAKATARQGGEAKLRRRSLRQAQGRPATAKRPLTDVRGSEASHKWVNVRECNAFLGNFRAWDFCKLLQEKRLKFF